MSFDRSPPPPVPTGLRGRCPRCGRGHLFQGYLTIRPRCEACGLDYGFAEAGDGPAFFIMLVVGFVVAGLAMWVEFTYEPPIWVHMALWIPLAFILCGAMLRPLKGVMIAVQYQTRAAEGRLRR